MAETQIRRPFLRATADQTLAAFFVAIDPILSASVTRGYDQQYGQATLVLPHPRPFWAALDDVFITVYLHDSQPTVIGSPVVDTDPPTCRFGGRLGGVDLDLYPSTVVIRCFDLLYMAAKYYPTEDHDFAGMTDEEIVRAVLAIVGTPLFIEDPDPIAGSGVVVSADELIWPRMESALDVILEMDALTGYRTFVDANGVIRRAPLSSEPAADGAEDYTLIEGVDLFDAHGTFDFMPATADLVGLDGETIELVSADVDRRSVVTPRSDIFEPGQTIRVTAAHLGGTDRNYWLQAITITIDEQGAFTQQLDLTTGTSGVPVEPPTDDCATFDAELFLLVPDAVPFVRAYSLSLDQLEDRGTIGAGAFSGLPIARGNFSTGPTDISSGVLDSLRSTTSGCASSIEAATGPGRSSAGAPNLSVAPDRAQRYAARLTALGTEPAGVYKADDSLIFSYIGGVNPSSALGSSPGPRGICASSGRVWMLYNVTGSSIQAAYMVPGGATNGTLVPGTLGVTASLSWAPARADDHCLVERTDLVRRLYRVTTSGVTEVVHPFPSASPSSYTFKSRDGTVWLAGSATSGLYRSTDQGSSWTAIDAGFKAIQFEYAAGRWFARGDFTGTTTGQTSGIIYSDDDGATWTSTPTALDANAPLIVVGAD